MITHIEKDEIEGENVYAETWDPSPEQMTRYLDREIATCKANIAALKKAEGNAYGMVHLHSWATALEAVTGIKVERKPLVTTRGVMQ